jgi:hypothetical protein
MSTDAPSKWRKKPVEIEAWRIPFDPTDTLEVVDLDLLEDIAGWCGGAVAWGPTASPAGILIETMEGTMRADLGDWIIKGVKGEFYPCKPDIFDATYDYAGPHFCSGCGDVVDACTHEPARRRAGR